MDYELSGIKSISIRHFRSFFKEQTIKFGFPNGKVGSGLTIITGPNNSGKRSILAALKRTDPYDKFGSDEKHKRHKARITIVGTAGYSDYTEKVFISTSKNTSKYQKANNNDDAFDYPGPLNFFVVGTNRRWSSILNAPKNYKEYGSGNLGLLRNNSDKGNFGIPYDFLEKRFWEVILAINEDKDGRRDFNQLMRTVIPEFNDWCIDQVNGQLVVKYILKDGIKHKFDFQGDGVRSVFKILSVFFIHGDIPIIDEPELHLQPQTQRRLANLFSELATRIQIIIITHSPQFINWSDIENGAHVIRCQKDSLGSTRVYDLSPTAQYNKLLFGRDNWRKPHILDHAAKEIFFTQNIVFLEGQEDIGLLTKFIKEREISINFQFFGYGSDGASNIKYLLALASDLGIKAGAIFDGDQKSEMKICGEIFDRKFSLQNISTADIRDKEDRDKIGLFWENGKIKGKKEAQEIRRIIQKLVTHFDPQSSSLTQNQALENLYNYNHGHFRDEIKPEHLMVILTWANNDCLVEHWDDYEIHLRDLATGNLTKYDYKFGRRNSLAGFSEGYTEISDFLKSQGFDQKNIYNVYE